MELDEGMRGHMRAAEWARACCLSIAAMGLIPITAELGRQWQTTQHNPNPCPETALVEATLCGRIRYM